MQTVSTSIIVSILSSVCVNSCSPPYPQPGQLYIANVQLLSETAYTDSVLLTIRRTTNINANYLSSDPWCKIMNIHDGSVGDTVLCADYNRFIRPYADPDIDPKSTSVKYCHDNCDGTATCTIIRDDIPYNIHDVPYLETPSTDCKLYARNILFTSFTINDITTTYISFSSNMVAIQFDDNVSPTSFNVYNVEKRGDWSYLIPEEYGFSNAAPSIYSNANVMRVALPCCICHSSRLVSYDIVTDTVHRTQIFTLKALGFGGGNVDDIGHKVYNAGLFYSKSVTVYDLSNNGVAHTLTPHLCDMMVSCFMSPCSQRGIGCPYNTNARCVDDFCGGCNARWFCGSMEITNYCDSGLISKQMCSEYPIQSVHGSTLLL